LLENIENSTYNRKKTSVYHTDNGNRALFYISKNSKSDKGYITKQHVDILTR